jgi:hypothetical protein
MDCKGTIYNVGGKNFCVGEKKSSKKYGTKRMKKSKNKKQKTKKKY